jgi:hypothetical protein
MYRHSPLWTDIKRSDIVTTATRESDLVVPDTTADPITSASAAGSALGAAPAAESERPSDFEVRIAIQSIASRILGSALLERAQEVDSIAT